MSDDMEIRNAIITKAYLTTEDHGVLSGWLSLDYGGSGQGFGGHVLAVNPDSPHWPGKANYCGVWITRVLECAGVTKWDQLVGKTIRVRCCHHKIEAIGHIIKDKWFFPEREFKDLGHE